MGWRKSRRLWMPVQEVGLKGDFLNEEENPWQRWSIPAAIVRKNLRLGLDHPRAPPNSTRYPVYVESLSKSGRPYLQVPAALIRLLKMKGQDSLRQLEAKILQIFVSDLWLISILQKKGRRICQNIQYMFASSLFCDSFDVLPFMDPGIIALDASML